MASFDHLTKDLDAKQLADLQRHVNSVSEARRQGVTLESIRPGMSPEHEAKVRAEILRVLGELK